MQELFADLWKIYDQLGPDEFIGITTNGDVNAKNQAVMGRGCALECAKKFPEFRERLASLLKSSGNQVYVHPAHKIVTFPVKIHWHDNADFGVIAASCLELRDVMQIYDMKAVYLVRPGVGNGHRSWADVKPILEKVFKDDPRLVIVAKPCEQDV